MNLAVKESQTALAPRCDPDEGSIATPEQLDGEQDIRWIVVKSMDLGRKKIFRVLKSDSGDYKVQFIVEEDANAVAEMSIKRFASTSLLEIVKRGEGDVHYKTHIGGNMYLQVNSPYRGISVRQFKNIGDSQCVNLIPDKKGIFLLFREWNAFLKVNKELDGIIPDLATTTPCMDQIDHCNQEGYYTCMECCPNGENRHWF